MNQVTPHKRLARALQLHLAGRTALSRYQMNLNPRYIERVMSPEYWAERERTIRAFLQLNPRVKKNKRGSDSHV